MPNLTPSPSPPRYIYSTRLIYSAPHQQKNFPQNLQRQHGHRTSSRGHYMQASHHHLIHLPPPPTYAETFPPSCSKDPPPTVNKKLSERTNSNANRDGQTQDRKNNSSHVYFFQNVHQDRLKTQDPHHRGNQARIERAQVKNPSPVKYRAPIP